MKLTIPLRFCICLALCSISLSHVHGQKTSPDLSTTILHQDSLFWQAYNQCDVPAMMAFITDDIEFYHDRGGLTKGGKALENGMKSGLCGNPDLLLRREAIPGTVKVFPLQSGDTTYGAILSGEHVFYINQTGREEYLDGQALFTHVWLLQPDNSWKMARILSFDHGPADKR